MNAQEQRAFEPLKQMISPKKCYGRREMAGASGGPQDRGAECPSEKLPSGGERLGSGGDEDAQEGAAKDFGPAVSDGLV